MISFPEQLSTAGGWQFDAQLNFMRTFTATAERVMVLNISASRAAAERTANTVRQLFSTTDPRDLFNMGAQAQEQLTALFEYGQELVNIALDARQNLSNGSSALRTPMPEPEPAPVQSAPQGAASASPVPEQSRPKTPPASRAAKKLVVVADEQPAAQPRIRAKPIARAVRKVAGKGADLPHPLASTVANEAEVHLPELKPAVATPASAEVLELKQPQTGASKAQRKK